MKKLLLRAAMLFVAVAFVNTVAHAQTDTCVIINGVKCIIRFDAAHNPIDTLCPGGGSGSATFQGPVIPPQGPVNVVLQPVTINSTVSEPTIGIVTTSLDRSRPAPPTTINSNIPGLRFPLTVNINFNASTTISSQPGRVYLSRTPLNLRNTNVNSIAPFENVAFPLVNDVDFYDQNDPQQATAFRLRAGSNVVIGTNNNPPLN